MTTTLQTATGLRQCADELIAWLTDLPDAVGDEWTQENFRRLEQFSEQRITGLRSYYRKHHQRVEFLWDFIASAPETGIFLAAESEQGVDGEAQVQALKHDFEKLLYVYSPIRVLITKARDRIHADHSLHHSPRTPMNAVSTSIQVPCSYCTSACGMARATCSTYGRAPETLDQW